MPLIQVTGTVTELWRGYPPITLARVFNSDPLYSIFFSTRKTVSPTAGDVERGIELPAGGLMSFNNIDDKDYVSKALWGISAGATVNIIVELFYE